MPIPDDRKYSSEHLWVRTAEGVVTIGITDHAQDELGEIVYIQLPETGATVRRANSMGEIESIKTVSDLISPVSGEVTERNDAALDTPAIVNSDPYEQGWLLKVRVADVAELEQLLSASDYSSLADPAY